MTPWLGAPPEDFRQEDAVGFVAALGGEAHLGADDPGLGRAEVDHSEAAREVEAGFGHQDRFGAAEHAQAVGVHAGDEQGARFRKT